MRIESFLEGSAARTPDKIALVSNGHRFTYGALERLSNSLACGLHDLGVQRGDRVAIYLENVWEAVVAIFGALKADGAFVVLNPSTKVEKLAALLNDCRATVLITDIKRQQVAAQVGSRCPDLAAILVAGTEPLLDGPPRMAALETFLKGAETPTSWRRGIDIDVAALIYTSGSTGKPKAVTLSHVNMLTAATSITTYLESRVDDVVLNVLPLSFDYGLYQVLMTFQVGGTIVLERSFAYLHAVLGTLVREGVTGFPVVPTIVALLLQLDMSGYDLTSLRYITSTGAPLPTAHITALRRLLPHVRIYSMYGLTECKRVSFLPPQEIDRRPSSVGRGMPNEEVYVVDDDGKRLPAGTGELVIRGSHVMLGYWEQPEETRSVLRPGPLPGENVLHSGDVFRIDEDGYLYFVGRKDDIIKSCGEKVSPREVEDVLHRLDGVAEAAVVPVDDEILGQAIKAVIAVKQGAHLTKQDVYRHCCQFLEDSMIPHIVEFRDGLPRTSHGKRDVAALRSTASGPGSIPAPRRTPA